MGPRRDRRRLRAPDPHAAARRDPHDEHPGPRRRPRARGHHDPGARGLSARPAIRRMYPEQIREGPARLAAEEAVLHRRLRRGRRGGGRRRQARRGSGRGRRPQRQARSRRRSASASSSRASTPAAYDALLGRTYAEIGSRRAQQSQVPGHGGLPPLPGVAGGRGGGGRRRRRRTQLMDSTIPGQMDKDETSLFDGIDISLAGIGAVRGRQSARRRSPPASRRSSTQAQARAEALRRRQRRRHRRADRSRPRGGARAARAARARWASTTAARYEIDFRLEDQGARLRGRRARRAWPDLRCGRRRWAGDRRPAGEALARRGEPRRRPMSASPASTIAGFDAPGSVRTRRP